MMLTTPWFGQEDRYLLPIQPVGIVLVGMLVWRVLLLLPAALGRREALTDPLTGFDEPESPAGTTPAARPGDDGKDAVEDLAPGEIRHFWASELMVAPRDSGQEPRHVDFIWPVWNVLDATPGGRDWSPQREYEPSA